MLCWGCGREKGLGSLFKNAPPPHLANKYLSPPYSVAFTRGGSRATLGTARSGLIFWASHPTLKLFGGDSGSRGLCWGYGRKRGQPVCSTTTPLLHSLTDFAAPLTLCLSQEGGLALYWGQREAGRFSGPPVPLPSFVAGIAAAEDFAGVTAERRGWAA